MSALPDAPSDLLDWALRTGRSDDPQGFLPRADFAIYLQDRLTDVADDRLRIQAGRVVDIVPAGAGFEVVTERSRSIADAVVLCHGNQPPRPLRVADGADLPEAPWHLANPWDLGRLRHPPGRCPGARRRHGADGDRHRHHPARGGCGAAGDDGQPSTASCPSRTSPSSTPPGSPRSPKGRSPPTGLAAAVHRRVRGRPSPPQGVNWRNVVDGLRPDPPGRLAAAPPSKERRRFLAVLQTASGRSGGTGWPPGAAAPPSATGIEGRLTVEDRHAASRHRPR